MYDFYPFVKICHSSTEQGFLSKKIAHILKKYHILPTLSLSNVSKQGILYKKILNIKCQTPLNKIIPAK